MKLPAGITSIRVEDDPGCGDLIVIRFDNDFAIVVDNNNLSGTHEAQIGVYTDWDSSDGDGPIASIVFDPVNAPEASVHKV